MQRQPVSRETRSQATGRGPTSEAHEGPRARRRDEAQSRRGRRARAWPDASDAQSDADGRADGRTASPLTGTATPNRVRCCLARYQGRTCRPGCGKGTPVHCWGGCESVRRFWKTL